MKSIYFLFSGQGSHFFQMGKDLFLNNDYFKNQIFILDESIKKIINKSIIDYMYDTAKTKNIPFIDLNYSHYAIFIIEYSLAKTLIHSGINPDYLIGSSLGEITSMALAEILSINDIIELLQKQIELLNGKCPPGGMLTILHDLDFFEKNPDIFEGCEIASINNHNHFVISGKKSKIDKIRTILNSKNIICQDLNVPFAFHSKYIDSIKDQYFKFLKTKIISPAKYKIISCTKGVLVNQFDNDYFWDIIRKTIRIDITIKEVLRQKESVFIDLSPSSSFVNFIKMHLNREQKVEIFPIITPFDNSVANLEKLKSYFLNKENIISQVKGSDNKDIKMKVYIFPGQGSQKKGMGLELFGNFKEYVKKANDILGYSIEDICINDPDNKLNNTQFTQPALYIVNALTYLQKVGDTGKIPDVVAGHSLGEYSALFAAGAFDFETGLKLVKKRGELMAMANNGGMAAVIGLDDNAVNNILKQNGLSTIHIANYNTPTQIVVSGPVNDILKAQTIFENGGAMNYVPLKVSGAFHSEYMKNAAREFENYINDFVFFDLNIPVISNITARSYNNANIKNNLVNQITNSVKWSESIRYIMGIGEVEFEEIGPGNVLGGLVKRIQREATPLSLTEMERKELFDCKKIKENINDNIKIEHEKGIKKEEEKNGDKISVQEKKSQSKKKTISLFNKKDADDIKSKDDPQDTVVKIQDHITAESLGAESFRMAYNVKYAYVAGSMYRGISSKDFIIKMARSGFISYFGTSGLSTAEIEDNIKKIRGELSDRYPYGVNLTYSTYNRDIDNVIDLLLKNHVNFVEISGFYAINPAVAFYKIKGLNRNKDGEIISRNRIMAKVSNIEVAEMFMQPIPEKMIAELLSSKKITDDEALIAKNMPYADELCAISNSAGFSEQGNSYSLLSILLKLRDDADSDPIKKIHIGLSGGIGTPDTAASAFIMGADFIATGTINQCTVEAATSNEVKDLLQQAGINDTEYAPAYELFELGARTQVLRKGVFFTGRANRLYELYRNYDSFNEITDKIKKHIEEKYFKRSIDSIYNELTQTISQEEYSISEKNPKYKMALIIRWYLNNSIKSAITGKQEEKINFQIPCSSAMGALNRWVKDTKFENWQNRHVDDISYSMMDETARMIKKFIVRFNRN